VFAIVEASLLNVRKGPGTDYPVAGTVASGECLSVTDMDAGWFRLSLPEGVDGWSSGRYLRTVSRCPAHANDSLVVNIQYPLAVPHKWGVVTAERLNVRSGPSVNQGIVGALFEETCVDVERVLDTGDATWIQVVLPDGATGWSHGDFIQLTSACPSMQFAEPTYVVADEPAEVAEEEPSPAITAVADTGKPGVQSAAVEYQTFVYECFGAGPSQLRQVAHRTPVSILGIGSFQPTDEERQHMDYGPYAKVRIWDGQYAWIAAKALGIKDPQELPVVSGLCEPDERIDWASVDQPLAATS
jgi:uncharacterized protein YraI